MSSLAEIRPAPAPAIVSTVTAVPAHSATQEQVKARLRDVFDLTPRRLEAAMELFDHAGVERRYSVEPIDRLGVARPGRASGALRRCLPRCTDTAEKSSAASRAET